MDVIVVPDPSLVVLVGAAGSGKSTFAARHFAATEILSSDAFRASISGDPADQSASAAAFKALHASLDRRLRAGRLTVVDATNLAAGARGALLAIASSARIPAVAIVLDVPAAVALARNAARHDRVVPEAVVRRHLAQVRSLVDGTRLGREGFDRVVVRHDPLDIEAIEIRRVPDRGIADRP